MARACIIGTTTWGITLGVVISKKNTAVSLWARTDEEAQRLRRPETRPGFLPESVDLPARLTITSSLAEATKDAEAVIMAVPSQSMRHNIRLVAPFLKRWTLVISAAKGLETGSGKRMSQVIAEEIDPALKYNICALSGPNLAWEILHGAPAVTVLAAEREFKAKRAARIVAAPGFTAYTNTDLVGVELGGALKNIIALGAGIFDGLGYGNNAKSALMTRGLTEISALGVSLGASPLTFSGLAGLGDLMATCASPLSRNHYVGEELAKGRKLDEITATMDNVAEGVTTVAVAYQLARQADIAMPVTEAIYAILYQGADLNRTAARLMEAQASHELSGRRWKLFSLFNRRGQPATAQTKPD